MKPLPSEDQSFLDAAQAWIDLGDYNSANEELEKISYAQRVHPDVIEMRCQIYMAAKKWNEAYLLTEFLVQNAPKYLMGWLNHARVLHELNRTPEGVECLSKAHTIFPEVPGVCFHAARYAVIVKDIESASAWLKLCFERDTDGFWKQKALADVDIDPYWTLEQKRKTP